MKEEVVVYQVRAIDAMGNARIVHAYVTEEAASDAIKSMKGQTNRRYITVAVPNQPAQFWGINFTERP